MPPASPTLFVGQFPDRQIDRVFTPQGRLYRDEQVRSAAEALQGVLRGRPHIRDAQGKLNSLHGSPLKAAGGEGKNLFRKVPTREVQGQATPPLAFPIRAKTHREPVCPICLKHFAQPSPLHQQGGSAPVIQPASSLAKNRIADTTSCGCPIRPKG